MTRTVRAWGTAGLLSAAMMMAFSSSAVAGWGSYGSYGGGSSGGSSGGWASSGGSSGGYIAYGSWGSYGSCGSYGGPIRHILHHVFHPFEHHRVRSFYSCGSSGGGVTWGSYGSWGSSGGTYYGSSGGSSGGTYYRTPMSVPMEAPQESAPAEGTLPKPDSQTSTGGSALLSVTVPESAKVYVNGRETTSTGTTRQYISRGLTPGLTYTYEVRVVATINGQPVEDTKVVHLTAGDVTSLAFDLKARPETALTLHVPDDAKVTLAGNETTATGSVRVFRTTSLGDNEAWTDYKVRVSVDRNGQTLVKEETITLKAGEKRTLEFDFDGAKVASAR